MINFNDIKYERPSVDEFKERVQNIRFKLMTSQDLENAEAAIFEYEKYISRFNTAYSLCNILHDLDTSNDFYVEELEFFDEAIPTISELSSAVLSVMLNCPCAEQLKKKYGKMIFLKAQNQKEIISKEVIEDLARESALENEYAQLQSEAEIIFAGKEHNLSMLSAHMESTDRVERRACAKAIDDYYSMRRPKYDQIYDDMVKIRTAAAQKLGFANFTELGYKRMERFDYGREEVAAFRDAIHKYIVPITVKIREIQKERLGVDELMFYDLPCLFKHGNPIPTVELKDYEKVTGQFFRKIFDSTPSFFDVLSENGFTDLISRKNKSTGGYCMYLDDHSIPFIFMNGNGTADDVATVVHEGGHAYAAIKSAECSPFVECLSPTMETCEIHSTAMEYMSYPFMRLFYGSGAENYCLHHMTEGILFLPYGCMVDEFQHIIYDNYDMTPEDRHKVWKSLEEKYQPFIKYDDQPFHKMGGAWMKKDHIFTTPFYYIDYCLSQICALQLWNESREDMKSALIKYNRLCELGGNDTFLHLIKKAGLKSPFDVDVIKTIAYSCCDFLDL